jgi:hypothetical protein
VLGLDLVYGTDYFINPIMWINCNTKKSMDYIAADRRQKRKDTGIVFSKGMLFYEIRFTY